MGGPIFKKPMHWPNLQKSPCLGPLDGLKNLTSIKIVILSTECITLPSMKHIIIIISFNLETFLRSNPDIIQSYFSSKSPKAKHDAGAGGRDKKWLRRKIFWFPMFPHAQRDASSPSPRTFVIRLLSEKDIMT